MPSLQLSENSSSLGPKLDIKTSSYEENEIEFEFFQLFTKNSRKLTHSLRLKPIRWRAYRQIINGMHFTSIVSLIRLWKFYSKVLSQFDFKRDLLLICLTYYSLISHFITLIERHVFDVKACLLFIKKFVIIYCLIR
jgi:hypothetical protein